jgi:DNA repair protein RecN (Recombination protein N)
MLTTLRISGFAIVDALEVRFGPGLNVLTGETGAGKSILVNALHLVLGGRMSTEVLRDGAEEAVVEALFELPSAHPVFERLETVAGIARPTLGGTAELLVRRVAARGGRGRAFVNGALCTVGMLGPALRGVVDISGQHEHVSLLDGASHLELLDAFAGVTQGEGGGLVSRYRAVWAALAAAVRERERLAQDAGERSRRADYLAFQLKELEAADPRLGEDKALEQERRVLASSARLKEWVQAAEGHVYGEEGSAAERIGQAVRVLVEAAGLDPRLESSLGLLRSASAEVEEAGRVLSRYAEVIGGDPEKLAVLEERLECLKSLARKHGGSLEAALARMGEMRSELESSRGGEERLEVLDREIAEWGHEAVKVAGELSGARAEAARSFCEAVQAELGALAMGRCRIEVAFSVPEGAIAVEGRKLGAGGAEQAEILIAPNPGESARPLARIASGGELSRVLLAVKRSLARSGTVATHVFDEVDAGIGGAVAEAMGRVLAEVSQEGQVICVTHLPQVAAFADRHFRVEKKVTGGRTATRVEPLEGEEDRRQEVARMLAGVTVTASALEHAAELIAGARSPSWSSARPRVTQGSEAARGRRSAPARAAARRVATR